MKRSVFVLTVIAALLLVGCRPAPRRAADPTAYKVHVRAQQMRPVPAFDANAFLEYIANLGDRGAIEKIVQQEFAGTGADFGRLSCIIGHESGWIPANSNAGRGTPGVYSNNIALGLFQLLGHGGQLDIAGAALGRNPGRNYWSDVRVNSRVARWLFDGGGYGPWTGSGC